MMYLDEIGVLEGVDWDDLGAGQFVGFSPKKVVTQIMSISPQKSKSSGPNIL